MLSRCDEYFTKIAISTISIYIGVLLLILKLYWQIPSGSLLGRDCTEDYIIWSNMGDIILNVGEAYMYTKNRWNIED